MLVLRAEQCKIEHSFTLQSSATKNLNQCKFPKSMYFWRLIAMPLQLWLILSHRMLLFPWTESQHIGSIPEVPLLRRIRTMRIFKIISLCTEEITHIETTLDRNLLHGLHRVDFQNKKHQLQKIGKSRR